MRATIEAIPIERPAPTADEPQGLCLDKGYDYPEVPALAEEFGFTLHLRTRGEEAQAQRHAGARARRWVVERTHSWLNDFGKLRRCTERRRDCVDAYLALAAAIVTLRALLRAAWLLYRWDTRPRSRRIR